MGRPLSGSEIAGPMLVILEMDYWRNSVGYCVEALLNCNYDSCLASISKEWLLLVDPRLPLLACQAVLPCKNPSGFRLKAYLARRFRGVPLPSQFHPATSRYPSPSGTPPCRSYIPPHHLVASHLRGGRAAAAV